MHLSAASADLSAPTDVTNTSPNAHQLMVALVDAVETVVVGKRTVIERCVLALASGANILLEDVPGVGKTVLSKTLARTIDASFARVQGASDLLPGDITGSSVWNPSTSSFDFVPGPIFADVVLVDELNRIPPRSQSALLEVLAEHQVSVDGVTHPLPTTHFVIATQNPSGHAGTFDLPISQLDRFAIATSVGYPTPEATRALVTARLHDEPIEHVEPIATPDQLQRLRDAVQQVHVAPACVAYAVAIVDATREHVDVRLGASPRAALQLVGVSQAAAVLAGRDHVVPDDIKDLAPDVLAHRLGTTTSTDRDGRRAIVVDLLRQVAAPV